jgi:hypothetical protein
MLGFLDFLLSITLSIRIVTVCELRLESLVGQGFQILRKMWIMDSFPTREGGFQSLSPLRGEVWRGVCLYIKKF